MTEFWESSFQDKQAMWGFEPTDAAKATAAFFREKGLYKVLIPGFGYGRNARAFTDNGLEVTGIEISETAIAIAEKHFKNNVKIYHGSVAAMPFDQELYNGIFCHALIHLLQEKERTKLLQDCYEQLRPGGYMVFTAISENDAAFGQGEKLAEHTFLTKHGVTLFFYNADAIEKEFGKFGLLAAREIQEPARNSENKPAQIFWQITCKKSH